MPEIGDQLRQARMRNRIDITEVEAATKIRAKYLRALENEEWDLLPGPTFVKTFLRTYADYVGLDSRVLVEEYRQRYERPSAQELTPFGTNLGGRRARPRRALVTPWMAIAAGVIVLVAALYALSQWGDEGDGEATRAPQASQTPASAAGGGQPGKRKRKPRRTTVRLQVRATGPVSVCVEDAQGTPVIPNVTMQAGQSSRVFRGRRFQLSFGTGAAVIRIDGKSFDVSDAAPIGYQVRAGGRPRPLPESSRPTCLG